MPEPTQTAKLSALIREGIPYYPIVSIGSYFRKADGRYGEVVEVRPESLFASTPTEVAACALGCAYFAAYQRGYRKCAEFVWEFLSCACGTDLYDATAAHPVTGTVKDLFSIIVGLSDIYEWPREQIADWLEREGF